MYLFTWEAGNHCGVTDNPWRALDLAREHLAEGVPAHVDVVRPELSFRTLSSFYRNTGLAWKLEIINGKAECNDVDMKEQVSALLRSADTRWP